MTSANEFVAAFAAEVGLEPPDEKAIEVLLDVAGVAAHASERIAAPLTCWLVGQANLDPGQALELAKKLETRLHSTD